MASALSHSLLLEVLLDPSCSVNPYSLYSERGPTAGSVVVAGSARA